MSARHTGISTEQERRRRRGAVALPLIAAICASGLVYRSSMAAFTATTTTGANSWNAASVTLTNDHAPATVVFNPTGLKPGDTGTKCVLVTYSGDVAADVKFYIPSISDKDASAVDVGGNAAGDRLSKFLDFSVVQGDGDQTGSSSCGGVGAAFVADADGGGLAYNAAGTLAGGTLYDFVTAPHTNITNGVSDWAPGDSHVVHSLKTYKFTWKLDNTVATGLQGYSVSGVVFTWEAQNQ